MMRSFTAYIEQDPETGIYVGMVPALPGAHTQGHNVEELRERLKEVIELYLEEDDSPPEYKPRFVGLLEIEVTV